MGRQGSQLVIFLREGLDSRKYRNLIMENALLMIFSIILPHKTKRLNREDEHLFRDWYTLKGKKYIYASKHYTDAKQAITAGLRKSDYVEKVCLSDNKLTYRILNETEVLEKKRLKKEKNHKNDDALSTVESGYGSGLDSPRSDHSIVPLNDDLIMPSENEPPNFFPASDSSNLCEGNDVQFDNFLKSEPMDIDASAENYSAFADSSILFADEFLADLLPFDDNLNLGNVQPQIPSLSMTKCSSQDLESKSSRLPEDSPEQNEASNGCDLLQQANFLDTDLDNLLSGELFSLEDLDVNFPLVPEGNSGWLPEETEMSLNQLMEDISVVDSKPLVVPEGNKRQESSSDDPDLSGKKDLLENVNGPKGKFYVCKSYVRLGKSPILFCDPQFDASATDASDEIKIIFEDTILGEVGGFKSIKEYKFIDEHLMVILEPKDD